MAAPEDPEALPVKRKRGRPRARIKVTCGVCRDEFETIPSELARGAGRYCSEECRARARAMGLKAEAEPDRPREPTVERACERCGATFWVYPQRAKATRPARFCSWACKVAKPI